MGECSNALSCLLGGWLATHLIVFWCIIIGAGVLLLIQGISLARRVRRSWQDIKDGQKLYEEKENEWKVSQHRVQSIIRQGEEWCVDVSDLKTTTHRLNMMRKAAHAIEYEKALILLPVLPLMILVAVGSWVSTLWMLVVMFAALALSVIWWIYHGWKWYRYHWAFKVLEKREIDVAVKE